MAGVAGFEPATECVKIVDTTTFLRNADLHLTCIFVFISKLSLISTPYLAHILPVFQRRFSERKSQKAERISEAGFAVDCKNLLNLSISLDSFSLER